MCAEVSSFRKIKRYTARLPDRRGWCSGHAGPSPATRAPASPGPALGLRRSHAASLLPPLPVWPQAAHLLDALAPDGVPGRLQGTQCPPQVRRGRRPPGRGSLGTSDLCSPSCDVGRCRSHGRLCMRSE